MSTIEVHDSVDAIAQEWDDLADRVRAAPYLRPGWMGAWWRCFGEGRLVVIALRGRDGLNAVLPLEARGRDLCSLSNDETPRFGPVVADRAAEQALGRALFERAGRSVRLGWLSAEDAATLAVAAVRGEYRRAPRWPPRRRSSPSSGDWESYLGEMKADRRRSLRRRRRRLEEDGGGDARRPGRDGAAGCGPRGVHPIEGSGWKGEAGTAIRLQPELASFYTSVARWAADRGELRMAFLRVDGRPAAAHLYLQVVRGAVPIQVGLRRGVVEAGARDAPHGRDARAGVRGRS